ncbi:MAG: Holliday junction branch migration protein RuvA [Deltaproteobacteria bacterium]|uniref:Holliday junction branch migration complex subunit RuvA n=1 Tax=Candidatus Zymogenus saltonus TaxID=2844893 RepID=A0A9D8KGI8_9DELT|nr:Holliday junction branch migration protein RuvA [Candidatus Zymogenus saltonus]
MIALLRGRIIQKSLDSIVLDVGGVGYQVFLPLTTYSELPDVEGETSLHIYTYVREDAIVLFGFTSGRERGIFIDLIGISGVGPKAAVAILSGISPAELEDAILAGDPERLTAVPGIGKKTAERIVLELKSKVEKRIKKEGIERLDVDSALVSDVTEALVNLGYKRQQAQVAVRTALRKFEGGDDRGIGGDAVEGKDPGEVLKDSLKILSGN